MRIKNTLRNMIYACFSYIIIGLLVILVRRVFLNNLSIEYLGYDGLFSNIFSILMLADLNIEGLVLYRMFPAFANSDKGAINKFLGLYRLLYRYVGAFILAVGILLIPFLKMMIKEASFDWGYIYKIYFFQLIITVSSYFFAYKRIIFSVAQVDYIVTKIDFAVTLLAYVARIIVLIFFHDYLLYLTCALASNIMANLIISIKCGKEFEGIIPDKNVNRNDIISLGIHDELINNIVQKVGMTIYGATDNLVISFLLGIVQVGLYSNYMLILTYITAFFTKVFRPFSMTIGNFVYSESYDRGYKLFRMLDLASFFLASIVMTEYLCLFNPTIRVLFGREYLLGISFVMACSVNQYIAWNHLFLGYFRNAFGKYEKDKAYILCGAILNIVCSITLGKVLGITGIMIGTVIGHIGFWIGRMKIVYSEYIKEEVCKYINRQAFRIIVCFLEACICFWMCEKIEISMIGLVLRAVLNFVICGIINIIVFYKTDDFCYMKDYLRALMKMKK